MPSREENGHEEESPTLATEPHIVLQTLGFRATLKNVQIANTTLLQVKGTCL